MIIRTGDISFKDAQERIRRMIQGRPGRLASIMTRHGANIEVKAAAITPVDKGFLRRANKSKVDQGDRVVTLTVENRMEYAAYQHNYPHKHSQPNARDHFIALPFAAELPLMVDDIISADREAVS